MATSKIKGITAVDSYTVTDTNISAILNNGTVTLQGYTGNTGETTAGLGALLFTLKEGYRPISDTERFVYANYDGTSSFYLVKLYTDGKVKTVTGNKSFTGIFRFIGVTFRIQ